MSEKGKSLIPGALLVVIGLFLLLNRLDVFDFRWRHFYPIVMVAMGALFFISALRKSDRAGAFPGAMFLVLGLFFFFRNYDLFSFDYYFYDVEDFWPIFLIAVGAGFVALFLFKPEDWGVLVPGGVLLFFGSIFILRAAGFYYWDRFGDFWPVILIAIGLGIVINSFRRKSD